MTEAACVGGNLRAKPFLIFYEVNIKSVKLVKQKSTTNAASLRVAVGKPAHHATRRHIGVHGRATVWLGILLPLSACIVNLRSLPADLNQKKLFSAGITLQDIHIIFLQGIFSYIRGVNHYSDRISKH